MNNYNIFYVKKRNVSSVAPENLGCRGCVVDVTGKYKEIVRQTVDISLYVVGYLVLLGKCTYTTLGTTAHGTAHMCLCCSCGSACHASYDHNFHLTFHLSVISGYAANVPNIGIAHLSECRRSLSASGTGIAIYKQFCIFIFHY